MKSAKQSLVFGGLISSAGILIAKILGLVYVIPFNAIAGVDVQYYGPAYIIYSYILNVSIAGVPYAIATLVAKYYNAEDYKTTLLIKKISLGLMLMLGFAGMMFLILSSGWMAELIMSSGATESSIATMKTTLVLVSFALFFVPLLSSYRGFYQGLNDMEVYAFSQVLEQLTRVLFLLGAGAIAVYVFRMDQIWAVYFAVFSTSVAAICALAHMIMYDRVNIKSIQLRANIQDRVPNTDSASIFRELIAIALPYLLVAIVGYSNDLIDQAFFVSTLTATGMAAELAIFISGSIIFTQIAKVVAIPQIFAQGFSISVIPNITVSLEQKDYKKVKRQIFDCLESVIFISLPLVFCLFYFSREIMFLLFGNPEVAITNASGQTLMTIMQLDYQAYLLQWRSIDSMLGTIAPILTSLLMATRLRKDILRNLIAGSIAKLIVVVPCVYLFGITGSTISNIISYGTIIVLDILCLTKKFKMNWKLSIRKVLVMLLSCIGMGLVVLILNFIFGDVVEKGRIMTFIYLAVQGISVLAFYLGVTSMFQLPQRLLGLDLQKIMRKLAHARR